MDKARASAERAASRLLDVGSHLGHAVQSQSQHKRPSADHTVSRQEVGDPAAFGGAPHGRLEATAWLKASLIGVVAGGPPLALGQCRARSHAADVAGSGKRTEYLVVIEQDEDAWGAYVPDLAGCVAVGRSRDAVESLIAEVIPLHIESMREQGEPVPAPTASARRR